MATIEKRESKNGKVSYRVKVRLKGYPEISETFTTKTLAKEWADKTQSDIRVIYMQVVTPWAMWLGIIRIAAVILAL